MVGGLLDASREYAVGVFRRNPLRMQWLVKRPSARTTTRARRDGLQVGGRRDCAVCYWLSLVVRREVLFALRLSVLSGRIDI